MKTLKLFNAVQEKDSTKNIFVSEEGYILEPKALWAKDEITKFYKQEKLTGNDLNKTFHKSWEKVLNSSRLELAIEQIMHYLSTYGSDFQDEVYIPDEVLNVPDVKLSFKVIKALSKKELITKCLSLLESGIALQEETLNDILTALVDELDYSFTGKENIRNREAIIKIADLYNVLPTDTTEFLRYIIYKTTGESLLIKNEKTIDAIEESNYNPTVQFKKFGLSRLAEVFNRFKPLFLAFKPKCRKTINKISKLSKTYHKPLSTNPLNQATQRLLSKEDQKWLDNATPFALFKALSACYSRKEGQDSFVYRIRNGKSWLADAETKKTIVTKNYNFLLKYLQFRFDLSEKKIYLPEDVEYALPTSEKLFVGNIPTGTKFYGDRLAVGVYWKDSWGATDLDLSGLNTSGKVGWNSDYCQQESLVYSGDITSAPKGAVEYLYANDSLQDNTLILNNVYSGKSTCDYKIVIGRGDDVTKNYMMNPNKVFAEIKCTSVQKSNILGALFPEEDRQCFVLLNFGRGNCRVSENTSQSAKAIKALFQQWKNPLKLRDILVTLGAEVVLDSSVADIDLSLSNLQKDTFISLFTKKRK